LLQNLETCAARNGVAVEEYISFHSLFQTGCVPGTGIVMEEIYVHSKLMIIDDRYAVVGSANINDRSMAGTRDSEIALLIDSVESPAPFARTLRQALWAEHLGREIPSNPVESLELDILSDEGYHASWKRTSSVNTHIMIELFEHFPHGGTQTIEQYTQILKSKEEQKEPQELADEQIKSERMTQLCAGILGHVVDFPVQSDVSGGLAADGCIYLAQPQQFSSCYNSVILRI
jgi:phospholipase D1/2